MKDNNDLLNLLYSDDSPIDPDKEYQISELVEFILSKLDGKDVRAALAFGLKKAYEDAAESGNANMEVAQARGFFNNLNARLQDADNKHENTTRQLAHKVDKNATDLSINMFNEDDRNVLQGQEPGTINAVLGEGNVQRSNLAKKAVSPDRTTFLQSDFSKNLFDGNFSSKRVIQSPPNMFLADGTEGTHQTVIVPVKANTTYSVIRESTSDIFKIATDTIENRTNGETLQGSFQWETSQSTVRHRTFTTGSNDVVMYVYASFTGKNPLIQIVEGNQSALTIEDYPIVPFGVSIYSKEEVNQLLDGVLPGQSSGQTDIIVKKEGSKLNIYIPTKNNRYVYYTYERVINQAKNYDSWKIQHLAITDSQRNIIHTLSSNIEMEGAIREHNSPDFVGGWHGDEYLIHLSILLDGSPIAASAPNFEKVCKELRIVNRSYLNRSEGTERLFTRFRVNTFTKDGLHIEQKWTADAVANIRRSMLTMISTNKDSNGVVLQEFARTNKNYVVTDVSGDFSSEDIAQETTGITIMEMWGVDSDVYIRCEGESDRERFPNNRQWIQYLNTKPKIYYDVTGDVVLQPGESVEAISRYVIY